MRNRYTIFILTGLLLASCVSTKKSKQETGFIGKKFHDLTARYNGYFNAKELYNASISGLEENHVDNFGHLLPIYTYAALEDRSIVEADMDKAIEKVTKVAALHEPSKWVDDCYVLMAKAQYLKGDYETAQETLEYFIDDFNPKDPDSRVYQSPNRAENSKQRRQEAQRERKIQQDERKAEQAEKAKSRKQLEKERKKARKQREKERKQKQKDRKKGRKTVQPAQAVPVTKEVVTPAPEPKPIIASADNEVPLSDDEAYIAALEKEGQKARDKEVKKNTNGGFLKHKPAYYEGMLWLVKTYIARDKWLDANYYLDKIAEDPGVPDHVNEEIPVVRADLLIQQKNYNLAIPALEEAIEGSGNKKQKARLAFILAQIYQLNGDAAKAYASFDRVNDFKPNYEMSLNARLNQLRNGWATSDNSADTAIKTLEKMSKEDKNEAYLAAIYFTMAEIRLAEGDEEAAFTYFNKALNSSNGSGNQVDIYYRLASLFFGRERYKEAKLYFDSTLTIMAESDERYAYSSKYARNLTNIAKNIQIIEESDSLLYLGNLSEEDLRTYAAEKVRKAEANKKKEERTEGTLTATTSVISGNSKFFAYNQPALQRGKQDFNKRWGNRPLEDDWRRSNKSSSLLEVQEEEDAISAIDPEILEKEIDKIVRAVPGSEEDKTKVRGQLEQATFELGTGYRSYIENFSKSNETLFGLISDFPETKHRVEAYFYIYLNYLDLFENTQAETYLNKILNEFPESDYAIYLKNPTGDNVLMTEDRKIQVYYDQTYQLFETGKYEQAYDRLLDSKQKFTRDHRMTAKYDLLTAMCIGNLKGKDEYINALRGVSINHNNTPEQTYAREMLRFLRGDDDALGGDIPQEDLENFVLEDTKLHYIIVILYDASGPDVNEVKKQLNAYNEKYHASDRLRSTSIYLNQEKKTHLVLIRRFQDREKAMVYFTQSVAKSDEFIDTKKFSFETFSINQKNYREVIKAKSVRAYRAFFELNYL